MSSVSQREVTMSLGVVVERRISEHKWADFVWKPVSVFTGAANDPGWQILLETDGMTRYHAATVNMVLHRKETEAYVENLALDLPVIYVILQESDGSDIRYPWGVHAVTASPFEAQDYEDTGDCIIEKVAMPEEIAAFIQAYIERHHKQEIFIKRKRDKLKLEDQKFGKHPIFQKPTEH